MRERLEDLDTDTLHDRAYESFDSGQLKEAAAHFATLLQRAPDTAYYHYMLGLAHKYLRNWEMSLQHNLRAQALQEEPDESALWNAGIAATALGDWAEARRQWLACGLRIPEGDGLIDDDFGIVSIRLNPWGDAETVYARRIDIVRARLLNVPLPESGYRYGDIVLHDGAKTGEREFEDGHVPVFNALARLAPSDFQTFTVFASCGSKDDIEALREARLPGIACVEDWTDSISHYCLRCSYGTPHNHAKDGTDARDWEPDRNLGIAAQSRRSVEKLMSEWAKKGRGRQVDAIEVRETILPEPEDGHVWWRGPEDDVDEEDAD